MDSYALEKLTGWTPDLSPPPEFAAVSLAGAGRRTTAGSGLRSQFHKNKNPRKERHE